MHDCSTGVHRPLTATALVFRPLDGSEQPSELGEDDRRSFTIERNDVVIDRPLPDGIDVLRVFHGARDYERRFRDRER